MHLTESYYDLVENRHTDDMSINNFSVHFTLQTVSGCNRL